MKRLIVLILLSSQAWGGEAVFLPSGSVTKYDGYLITQDIADKARENKIDLDAKTRILKLMQDENVILEQRLTNTQTEMDRLSKAVVEERNSNGINKFTYFLLGAAATTLIAYGASRAVR